MKFLVLIAALAIASQASAGFRRGNGGHVLMCDSKVGKAYSLLDMYEATNRYHYTLEFATQGDEFQRAQQIIDRIKDINPTRYQLYSQWLSAFASEASYMEDMKFVDVPDLGVAFIPKNCRVQQMIMQVDPIQPQDKRYTIDQSLWRRLDVNQRAASIVHELIYREAISFENQHPHSEFARALNGFMHSSRMKSTNLREWLILLQNLGFYQADAQGFSVRLNTFTDKSYSRKAPAFVTFYDADHVRIAELSWKFKFDLFDTRYIYNCESNLVGTHLNSFVEFFEDGKPHRLALFHGPECSDFTLNVLTPTFRITGPIHQMTFDPNGDVVNMKFTRDTDAPRSFFFISTPNVEVFREFLGLNSPLDVEIDFKKNQPTLLINEVFNQFLSTTKMKVGERWVDFENKPIQEL